MSAACNEGCWKEEKLGQRLCVNIIDDGVRIANIHYRWGASSIDALLELKKIVNIINGETAEGEHFEIKNGMPYFNIITVKGAKDEDPLLNIIKCLAVFGGGINADDIELARRMWPGKEIPVVKSWNEGAVSISEKTMNAAEEYAIGDATIDLDSRTVADSCFYFEEDADTDEYNVFNSPYNLQEIPFDKIQDALEWIEKLPADALIHVNGEYLTMMS